MTEGKSNWKLAKSTTGSDAYCLACEWSSTSDNQQSAATRHARARMHTVVVEMEYRYKPTLVSPVIECHEAAE